MKTLWKRRLTQTSLLAALATISLGGVSATAADTAQATITAAAATTSPTVKPTTMLFMNQGSSSMLLQPAFQRNYLKLLAVTYAPDTIDAWKAALDERKQVESEMPKPEAGKRVMILNKSDAMGTVTTAIPASDDKAAIPVQLVPSTDGLNPDQLSSVSIGEGKQLTITKSQDGVVVKKFTQALPVEGKWLDTMQADASEAFKRQQKLAEAVDADDAATIRSLLPELLKDYQQETENLRDMVKKIKEAQAAEPTIQAQPTE
ncbi:hypothetical protein [Paenibacillus aestuarii]|uniref:DUF1002 domain-containing protein n=1 Tax=Paenibacillus aestuarii TaxID=516965 RepID=A0ABW0KC39_9BACL|nr:hypothetical protein [Paenibacillus aestuarii]